MNWDTHWLAWNVVRKSLSVDKSFLFSDHDFTCSSVTPSVALFIDIPQSMDGSFYHGKVCIGVKDSVFEGSFSQCHGAELSSLLFKLNYNNPMIFLYTDCRPDPLSQLLFCTVDIHMLVSYS